MALALSRWAGGVIITATTVLSFQNCSPGGFVGISSDSSVTLASLESEVGFTNMKEISGYTFSASYRPKKDDLTGMKVCTYPAQQGCTNDAEGKSKGRALLHESGLDPLARVHKMSFDFFSNNYFAKNREAHFAIGLRGDITNDSKGDPISVNGRGFIIGQLGGDPRNLGNAACSRDMAQIETYHGDIAIQNQSIPGNHIFSQSCSDAVFKDGRWYQLELYVSSDRKIGYKIFDDKARLVYAHLMQDPTDYLNPSLTKWFMGHVFDTPVSEESGHWSITVKNIVLSQSDSEIENNFLEKPMAFYLAGHKIAENELVNLDDLNGDSLAVGNFSDLQSRVFGCANPEASVNSGACSRASDFREILFSGDDSFRKDGARLVVLQSSANQFPANTYKLILRANPQSAYDQTVIRIIKK